MVFITFSCKMENAYHAEHPLLSRYVISSYSFDCYGYSTDVPDFKFLYANGKCLLS